MPDQPPLNPDGLEDAKASGVDCHINGGTSEEYGVTKKYVELVMDDIRTSRFDRDFEFYLVKDLLIEVWFSARRASDEQVNPFDSW